MKTLLTWHEVRTAMLAEWLNVKVETAQKKRDGRRAYTDADLVEIARRFQLDPRLLLWPPERVKELGTAPDVTELPVSDVPLRTRACVTAAEPAPLPRFGVPATKAA